MAAGTRINAAVCARRKKHSSSTGISGVNDRNGVHSHDFYDRGIRTRSVCSYGVYVHGVRSRCVCSHGVYICSVCSRDVWSRNIQSGKDTHNCRRNSTPPM